MPLQLVKHKSRKAFSNDIFAEIPDLRAEKEHSKDSRNRHHIAVRENYKKTLKNNKLVYSICKTKNLLEKHINDAFLHNNIFKYQFCNDLFDLHPN